MAAAAAARRPHWAILAWCRSRASGRDDDAEHNIAGFIDARSLRDAPADAFARSGGAPWDAVDSGDHSGRRPGRRVAPCKSEASRRVSVCGGRRGGARDRPRLGVVLPQNKSLWTGSFARRRPESPRSSLRSATRSSTFAASAPGPRRSSGSASIRWRSTSCQSWCGTCSTMPGSRRVGCWSRTCCSGATCRVAGGDLGGPRSSLIFALGVTAIWACGAAALPARGAAAGREAEVTEPDAHRPAALLKRLVDARTVLLDDHAHPLRRAGAPAPSA